MKLLVIRFSALGDVAMTVPVVDSLARAYPQAEITVLSRSFMQPLFAHMPNNVHFYGVDLKQYKGLRGILRLFHELKHNGPYDAVADLHGVLRTQVLSFFFRLTGIRTIHINKERRARKALIRSKQKIRQQLSTSFERYADVFRRLGLSVRPTFRSIYGEGKGNVLLFSPLTGRPDNQTWIGFAPFAAHRGKQLPEATSQALIRKLSARPNTRLFLFGGKSDAPLLEQWAEGQSGITIIAGRLKMEQELALMSYLAVMCSMDSANMHLASLTGTPVVSVWGATHPLAGFLGWQQQTENCVQDNHLDCRPCSIFGNKPCMRGDYACLAHISPENILQKIENILTKSSHS